MQTMIITITTVLCLGSILATSVVMFVIGTKTYNDSLTFGGIGPLFVFLLCAGACCGSVGRGRSMFESTFNDEAACCKACCIEMCSKDAITPNTSQQKVPVVPSISPETVTVSVQGARVQGTPKA